MKPERRDQLKQYISIRKLAKLANVNECHLSSIVNGNRRASKSLAQILTQHVNALLETPYFTIEDFRPENNK